MKEGCADAEETATIVNVAALLEAEDSGARVISGDGKVIEGIISERDVARRLRPYGTDAMAKSVTVDD